MEPFVLTRRAFLKALAASVLAAGVPLPIGLKREHLLFVDSKAAPGGDGKSWRTAFRNLLVATSHAAPGAAVHIAGIHTVTNLQGSPVKTSPIRLIGHDGGIQRREGDFIFEGHSIMQDLCVDLPTTKNVGTLRLVNCILTNGYRPPRPGGDT